MRALIRTGDPKALTMDFAHPEPTPSNSADYYLVRVHATALTREELTWPEPLQADIPIPGYDVAGVVISIPTAPHPEKGTWKFKPGDEIYAMTTFVNRGNAREISEAHEKEMALKPRNMSWEEAASVPLSGLSAWQAIFVHGGITPSFSGPGHTTAPRILVTAASGGVGLWGVQLAHLAGAEVVATCGPANVQFVRDLGADTVLDYTKTSLVDWVEEDRKAREFDVVLDCIGGKTLEDAWICARTGGKIISVAVPPDSKKPAEGVAENVKGLWFIVTENGNQLTQISGLVEQGRCKGVVDSVFELEQWEKAFERLESGHAKGKVILKIH